MSDDNNNSPPANIDKKPSKIRHTEDEQRIVHENTADESRLEHRENADENESIFRHENETSGDSGELQNEGSDANGGSMLPAVPPDTPENENNNGGEAVSNPADNQTASQPDNQTNADSDDDGNRYDIEGKLAGILSMVDKFVPDDENVASQAIKHDVLETPAAILAAISEVNSMRSRGQRLFFENKDDDDEPAESNDNEPAAVEADGETDEIPQPDEILALPEPVLSLPPGNEALESGETPNEDDTALTESDNPADEKNDEFSQIFEPTEKRDYYEVLGVEKDADEAEIKTAYRSLAKKYHPDVNSGDKAAEAKFKEANEAYSTLIDPQKREAYDRKTKAATAEKASVNKPAQRNADEPEAETQPADKSDKTPADGKKGGKRKKDRFMRRVLDKGFILTQAAAHLMPNEQQDENSGTTGVRKMISESAKIIKIIATAEKPKDKETEDSEDDERLTHEKNRLQHEELDGDSALQLENSGTPSGNLLTHGEVPQISDGNDVSNDSSAIVPINQDTEQEPGGDEPESEDISADTEAGGDSINPGLSDDSSGMLNSDAPDVIPKSKSDIKIENKIDKNIDKLTAEAAKLEKKIAKAEKKIPKKKVKKSKLVHDKKTGEVKREISFADEKINKADAKWNQGQSKTLSANTGRYVTGHASAFLHGKISQVENQTGNTGLQAAHTAEKGVVKSISTAKNVHRYVKNAPYRKLEHLKVREIQNKGKLAYQQLLKDKPELRKQPLARLIQKRRIKRQYAKALRAAKGGGAGAALGKVGMAVGVGAAAVSGDGKALAKMGAQMGAKIAFKKAGLALVKAAAPLLLKIGLIILIIGAVLLLFVMCASLFNSSTSFVLEAVSYNADVDDLTEYSVYMTELEVDIKEQIIDSASDVEGLHDFRFVLNSPSGNTDVIFEGTLITAGLGHPHNTPPVYAPPDFDPLVLLPFLTDITHDPFEVMAYLTTMYGDFTGHDINAILRDIFDTAFTLSITESFEVRTAVVECWYYELQDLGSYVDGVWVSNWQNVRVAPYTENMLYDWHYREVALTVNMTVSQVIQSRLTTDDQQERFDVLMESHGLRQFVGSPFADNWLGSVSSVYGYRFHPITQTREMHTGIDIAMPEGTPILSGAPGIVTFAGDNGGYGNTVIIEYFDAETGIGVRVLYAHLHEITAAVGDVLDIGVSIGTVGSTGTSTGNHLHMEVSINEDGGAWRHINPLFFVEPYSD